MKTRFWLVGAGPGRADLLTLRAARALSLADAVLYDRLVTAEVLALARSGAELVCVGKGEGGQAEGQRRIYELFEAYGRRPGNIVRLKGGDPFVFGRGAEEWAWLAGRGFDVEVVPGVSSSLAAPVLAGIPPTFRGVATGFAVVTGRCGGEVAPDWGAYARVETLVILMGVRQRQAIARALIEAGRPPDEPVAFVENATRSDERVVVSDLGSVALGLVEVAAPAVFVVGQVVRLRGMLAAQVAAGWGAAPQWGPDSPRAVFLKEAEIAA